MLREADRFSPAVERGDPRRTHPTPAAALARRALEIFLAAAETHPVIRAVVASESGDELLPLLTTRGGPLVARGHRRLARRCVESWPGLRRREAELVSDCLVRLAISHAALPAAPPAEAAAGLARILGPFVDELVG